MNDNSIPAKLNHIRQLMRKNQLDYYYIPSTDPHRNEYVPKMWQRRAWASGFTGSAGDALIGIEKAYLWTDSRYYLQAEEELDKTVYQLMRLGEGETPTLYEWLSQQRHKIALGVDSKLVSLTQFKQFDQALSTHNGAVISIEDNLIDLVAGHIADPPSCVAIHQQALAHAGKTVQNKLDTLRESMSLYQADACIFNVLDEIAWLFNIRGNDIPYNPLVISYAIVMQDRATLFVDLAKAPHHIKQDLNEAGVDIQPYEMMQNTLNQLTGHVWLDPNTASVWMKKQLTQVKRTFEKTTTLNLAKALKNKTEQKGAKQAHEIDAVAMIRFLHWLENHWEGNTELSAKKKLDAFRLENKKCLQLSFPTISAFAEHGAIAHYTPTPTSDIPISNKALYLVDSGGQYYEGTTDVTRTIHLGEPSAIQKRHYTLVLKGHLAIRHLIFPQGVCGEHIDAMARQYLWREGLDYGHGTGHGVGSYLCVHEGPQRISPSVSRIPLTPGMIVSNEPGYYWEHCYGIRIENLCLIEENKILIENTQDNDRVFYKIVDLTCVPYARNLMNMTLLTSEEIKWINDYHRQVYKRMENLILNASVKMWLKEATRPLT